MPSKLGMFRMLDWKKMGYESRAMRGGGKPAAAGL